MLNELLFKALWKMSGKRPHITRAGERFRYTIVESRGLRRIRASGEEYAVNCPNCGDSRGRLYVNHMYGLEYPGNEPELRGPMEALCYCQNENKCIPLRKFLGPYETMAAQYRLMQLPDAPDNDGVFDTAPTKGECTPLDQLPQDHPARQYLLGRGYDPDYLARHHKASVMCSNPDHKISRMAVGRIVFPFMVGGEEKMWQARLAYDLPKGVKFPPKWYFPPNTQKVPWNLDLASQYPVVVLCEGILSAINMGPAGVSIGGKSLTFNAIKAIKERWSCVVVALDPDAGIARGPDDLDYQERMIAELLEAGVPEVCGVQWDLNMPRRAGDKLDPGSIGVSGCAELLRQSVPHCYERISYFRTEHVGT